jgi:hypothetical protein
MRAVLLAREVFGQRAAQSKHTLREVEQPVRDVTALHTPDEHTNDETTKQETANGTVLGPAPM